MRPIVYALLLVVCPGAGAAQTFDFYARGPYRPAVPRPEAITGYAAGDQHTMYAVMQHYLDTLVGTAPERVRVERWGETFEHRPIRALIISDPANLARLDQIRADVAELTDPRKTTAARAAEIAAKDPVIVLFQYSVHGDEPAGFEAAMQVAYQMLASDEPATLDILKNVVLVLNPSANPDGHERFAAWYNSVGVGVHEPAAFEHSQPWSITRRGDDGTISTFRDGMAHHYPASLATLETSAKNRSARLLDYYDFRRSAMAEVATDRMRRVVLVPGSDPRTTAHVVGLLLRNGIEVSRLAQPAAATLAHPYMGGAAGRHTFPAGSYVIELGQPQRRLAKAILEPQATLQPDFVADQIAKFQRNRRRGEH